MILDYSNIGEWSRFWGEMEDHGLQGLFNGGNIFTIILLAYCRK
jgi:hypothetical protein